jgi:hypothetical protein
LRWRNHMKTFIWSSTFIFHFFWGISCHHLEDLSTLTWQWRSHMLSDPKWKCLSHWLTEPVKAANCSHIFQRFPVKERRKEMFRGFWFSTLATETCLLCTMC